jgi:hypothetical protein
MNNIPRMRTIPKAYEEIKKADPETDFTIRALRRMVNKGEIPIVEVESKRLINLDVLFSLLFSKKECYNNDAINPA